jgi:predicted NACHT family NTPase
LDEKLRVCQEIAISMQADDRAEYELSKVLEIIVAVLKNRERAESFLEHIRYRTGLLVERRPEVFAFAHLTFQEYLAACAVSRGNLRGIDTNTLAAQHADGRWNEVIALYCGLSSVKAAREMITEMIKQPDTEIISRVLGEAFLSSNVQLSGDVKFRRRVLQRLAVCPYSNILGEIKCDEYHP